MRSPEGSQCISLKFSANADVLQRDEKPYIFKSPQSFEPKEEKKKKLSIPLFQPSHFKC